jgi:hypothetical protein
MLWEVPTSTPPHPRGDGCSDVEARGEWMSQPECVVFVEGYGGVAGSAMARVATAGGLWLFLWLVSLRM